MRARRFAPALIACTMATSPACERSVGIEPNHVDLRESPRATRPGPRRILAGVWDTIFLVGGGPSDTLLWRPGRLRAGDAGVYVFDHGRQAVLRFTRSGRLLWSFGREGQGPDEFRNVRDLELDERGDLWVLDVANSRITVLSAGGAVRRRIPLHDIPHPEQLIPQSIGSAIVLGTAREDPLFLVAPDGTIRARLAIPWRGYRKLEPLAAQLGASAGPGGRFALGFLIGNGFFVFEDTLPRSYHGIYVEHTRFPTIQRTRDGGGETLQLARPTFSANALELTRERLYVHFAGATDAANALIDIYEPVSGGYLGTLRLPRAIYAFSATADRIYGLYADPYPALVAWRYRADELTPREEDEG